MPVRIKDGKADEADGPNDSEHNGKAYEDFLNDRGVGHEASAVAQPALGREGEVEGDGGDAGAGDEERLQVEGANVADVGQGHVGFDGGEAPPVDGHEPPEEHAEEHSQPDEAGEDGQPLEGGEVSFLFLFFYCCFFPFLSVGVRLW